MNLNLILIFISSSGGLGVLLILLALLLRKKLSWIHRNTIACYFSRGAKLDRLGYYSRRLKKIDHHLTVLQSEIKPLRRYKNYLTSNFLSKRITDIESQIEKIVLYEKQIEKIPRPIKKRKIFTKKRAGLLLYSKQHKKKAFEIKDFLVNYNIRYIAKQKKIHKKFFDGTEFGPRSPLNNAQIEAILTNDSLNLVTAGPGSGKTRVLTDRVAFYIHKKKIKPSEILILAFTRNAVDEIKQRLKKNFKIDSIEVRTFHSLGKKIISKIENKGDPRGKIRNDIARPKKEIPKLVNKLREKKEIENDFLDYFSKDINYYTRAKSTQSLKRLKEKEKSLYMQQQLKKYETLDGTKVKSIAEAEIANFLIKHGIRYQYEKPVDWCDKTNSRKNYRPDFYLPDYDIYIEHWAIDKRGRVPNWFTKTSREYRREMKWKKAQFKKHQKTLWETNTKLWRKGQLETKLRDYFIKKNIPLEEIPREKLIRIVVKNKTKVDALTRAITNAIKAVKVIGMDYYDFVLHLEKKKKTMKEHEIGFYKIVKPVFLRYSEFLQKHNKFDYEDMINIACKYLENYSDYPKEYQIVPYKMIFIDEFQDISKQRLNLIENIRKLNPDTRLFCVGDDWQAIFSFSGASNKYLVEFDQRIGKCQKINLTKNYRNPQTIIDVGTEFIYHCEDYLEKQLKVLNGQNEQAIELVSIKAEIDYNFQKKQAEKVYQLIKKLIIQGIEQKEIMVLSRFHYGYTRVQEKCEKDPELKVGIKKDKKRAKDGIWFDSMHGCKGTEAEIVILLNIFHGQYGFPSEITSCFNPRFINEDLATSIDEQRRLMFVILTRAKRKVYLFFWENNESEFLLNYPQMRNYLLQEKRKKVVQMASNSLGNYKDF